MKDNLFYLIQKNGTTILLLLFLLIVGTGMFYNNLYPAINNSQLTWYSYHPSDDFNTSVYLRTTQMLRGEEMNISGQDSASGQIMPLLFSPFLSNFKPSLEVSYFSYLGIAVLMFTIFFMLLMRKSDKNIANGGLVFLAAFLLSEAGYLGIRQGNIDILLAPIMGIIIIIVLNSEKGISVFKTILIAIVAGAIINAKIFLLPIAIIVTFFSKRRLLSTIAMLITFVFIVYFPNLFGSPSSIPLFFGKIINWNNIVPITHSLSANHSPYAIASFFSNCLESSNCDSHILNNIIAVAIILFTFITPFAISKSIKKMLFSARGIKLNRELILVLLVLSVAFMNLFFKIAYDYRLYFSFIATLILFREAYRFKESLVYCYFSMFCLLIGGLWIRQVFPDQFATLDSRLLSIFYVFHFFFLILSAVTLWKEAQSRHAVARS